MTKKIIISSNSSWNIVNFRLGLASCLKEQGYLITIAAPKDQYSPQIESLGFRFIELNISARSTNIFQDALTFLSYIKIFLQVKPDYFLGFTIKPNIWGGLAARILGINRVLNIAGLGKVFEKENFLNRLVRFLYLLSLSGSKRIFFQNREDLSYFHTLGLISAHNVSVLPGSGVNLTKFAFSPIPKTLEQFHFLFMGRLLYSKGIRELVEASKLLHQEYKNFHVSIYGIIQNLRDSDAVSEDYLKALDSYSFIGFYGASDRPSAQIEKTHCVVLPSYYNEGTPKVLLEACAMGKPIITSDWKGCRDVVESSSNGYLCEIQSPKSLCDKMKLMIDLTDEGYQKFSKISRKVAETRYNEELVFNHYIEAID